MSNNYVFVTLTSQRDVCCIMNVISNVAASLLALGFSHAESHGTMRIHIQIKSNSYGATLPPTLRRVQLRRVRCGHCLNLQAKMVNNIKQFCFVAQLYCVDINVVMLCYQWKIFGASFGCKMQSDTAIPNNQKLSMVWDYSSSNVVLATIYSVVHVHQTWESAQINEYWSITLSM